MGRRNSTTQNRRHAVEDRMLDHCRRRLKPLKEDDYDDENPSVLPTRRMDQFTRKQREAMKAQEGRSVIYAPDADDDIHHVPEKGTTSDDGYYKKWFKRNID